MSRIQKSYSRTLPKETSDITYDTNYINCVKYVEDFFKCNGKTICLNMSILRKNEINMRDKIGDFSIRNFNSDIIMSYNISDKDVDVRYHTPFISGRLSENFCVALFTANKSINDENKFPSIKYEVEKPNFQTMLNEK